jgi:hypothetical protein
MSSQKFFVVKNGMQLQMSSPLASLAQIGPSKVDLKRLKAIILSIQDTGQLSISLKNT